MRDLAMPGDQGHRPGNLSGIDEPVDQIVDPLQPFRGQAHRFGLDDLG